MIPQRSNQIQGTKRRPLKRIVVQVRTISRICGRGLLMDLRLMEAYPFLREPSSWCKKFCRIGEMKFSPGGIGSEIGARDGFRESNQVRKRERPLMGGSMRT